MPRTTVLAFAFVSILRLLFPSPVAVDDFFESDLDGSWAGYFVINGNRHPLSLNMDAQDDMALGYVMMPNNVPAAPNDFEVLPLFDTSRPNAQRVTFSVLAADGYTYTFGPLRYVGKSDTLRGRMRTDNPGVAKASKVILYRTTETPTGLWTSAFNKKGRTNFAALQLFESKTGLAGYGVIDGMFGRLAGVDFANGRLTGQMITSEAGPGSGAAVNVGFDLQTKGLRLVGTLSGAGFNKTRLAAAGTAGKNTAITSVSPTALAVGGTTTVTIKGKQLSAAMVPHFADAAQPLVGGAARGAGTRATGLRSMGKTLMEVDVFVPGGTPNGTSIDMRLKGPGTLAVDEDGTFKADEKQTTTTTTTTSTTTTTTTTTTLGLSFEDDIYPIFSTTQPRTSGGPAKCIDCHFGGTFPAAPVFTASAADVCDELKAGGYLTGGTPRIIDVPAPGGESMGSLPEFPDMASGAKHGSKILQWIAGGSIC